MLETIVILVTIGMVLDFGGVQPLACSLAEVVLFLAVVALLFRRLREENPPLKLPLWPVLFVLFAGFAIVPLPSGLVAKLSPARLLDPAYAGLAAGNHQWTTLSVYPHDTLSALVRILAYLSAFLLAAYLFDSHKRKSSMVLALVCLGSFEAAYGIFQYLTGWQKIFTYTKQHYLESATGTYINHNHFAGFLEMTIPLAFAQGFYFFQLWSEGRTGKRPGGTRRGSPPASRTSSSRSATGLQSFFYLFLVAIMMVGIGFSVSRGGVLSTVLSVVFVSLLALARLEAKRRAWILGVFFLLTCVVGYGLWIGLDKVMLRFEQVHEAGYLQMEGRISTWHDTLRLIHDYPVTGTGLGTYGLAFRRYQTALVNYFFEHAHNDYLEFASDTGLPGAALLFVPILVLLAKMIVSFLGDPRRYRRAVTLGCIGGTVAILIHSAIDFNLQIPANALVFAIILGIAYKGAWLEPRTENSASTGGARSFVQQKTGSLPQVAGRRPERRLSADRPPGAGPSPWKGRAHEN